MTKNQNNLLIELSHCINHSSKKYESLNELSVSHWGIKSFSSTFENLLRKGYVQHFTGHNDNSFLMTVKGSKKARELSYIR